jgi:hypothetical protein
VIGLDSFYTPNQYYTFTASKSNLSAGANPYYVTSCFGLICVNSITCDLDVCINTWSLLPTPCVDGIKTKIYYDSAYCDERYDFPLDNGTYIECSTPPSIVNNTYSFSDDQKILLVLLVFLILCLVGGITVHEAFFGGCALITALILTTFLIYAYPTILIYASIFLIMIFSGMWVLVARVKR